MSLLQLRSICQRSKELQSAPILLDASRVCCILQVLRRVAGSRAAGVRHPTGAGAVALAARLFSSHGCFHCSCHHLNSCQPSCQPSQNLSVAPPSADASQSWLHYVQMVVMGFSQGGAMALLSLRFQAKVAAVLGLSSYLVLAEVCLSVQLRFKRQPAGACTVPPTWPEGSNCATNQAWIHAAACSLMVHG